MKVLLIIFCLGIFLIPKDNFYAQASQENCCKTDSKTDDCCNKDHSNHDKKDGKSSCNDDCCSFCMTCHTFVENISNKAIFFDYSDYYADNNLRFQYSDPYISNSLKDIWQPPKLS
ncbi:hypothetical protein [Chryseobacterium chendengshani]|uniref:hypothetical protein n=1 Tax=Chryseobacterium sp. LJ756 TaxID=2864113 RepID=UPI001C63D858|nr:hypothetical protein [Chryseobacterium sp. LJ756]MBW7675522.1 hypothetical protein [Chryseobacterium sp. LJ756]